MLLISVTAFALTLDQLQSSAQRPGPKLAKNPPPRVENGRAILLLLFTTGLATMGMEVIWIRLFTPYVGPVVYSFARILAAYLLATFAGSQVYRFWSRRHTARAGLLWVSLAFFGLLPLLTSDARLAMNGNLRVLLGVAPFAGVIGFLTPMLVDRWSAGDPDRAGRAYAVNVVGCIVGPLLAGFFLLPWFGERTSMLLLVLPWFAMAMPPAGWHTAPVLANCSRRLACWPRRWPCFFLTRDYETQLSRPASCCATARPR